MRKPIKKHYNVEKKLKENFLKIEDIVLSNERNAVKVELINEILGKMSHEFLDIHHRSLTDQLTGFVNRWFLNEFLKKEFRLCQRYKKKMSLAMLDVDYLKKINDELGHIAGDKALVKIAEIIKANIRSSDVVSRYGGDEFVIIFPLTELKEAKKVTDRIEKLVSEESLEKIRLGITTGMAEFSPKFGFIEDMIKEADQDLYVKKSKRK